MSPPPLGRRLALSLVPLAALLALAGAARAQTWPSVATELPSLGGGKDDVAVIVGVSDYFALPDVPGAADNARDWAQHLVRVRGVPGDRVTLLVDSEATRERIERAVQAAAAQARPTGTAFVVFVGHGAPAPSGDDGLLLGADTQADADSLSARGVPQARLAALLGAGRQKSTVLVYDACFSGMSSDAAQPLVPGNQATLPVRKAAAPRNVITLSSSETFAGPLPGQKRPAFSYLLLGAARGWADKDGDAAVTLAEAFSFTADTLRAALKQSSRVPHARGDVGGVVLARAPRADKLEAAPDTGAILLGRCPDGARWDGRACAKVPCPTGTSWNGSACAAAAASVLCPPGTSWNGNACAASSVVCPGGATWDGSTCRFAPTVAAAPRPVFGAAPPAAPARAAAPAPTERGAERGAARGDSDGDGTVDAKDHCPFDPEDKDGFEDDDGCPDPDNDRDGVLDTHDRCVGEPENKNGFQDDDGCPDERPKAGPPSGTLILMKHLAFESAKARIKPTSNAELDALAAMLKQSERRARVECHTDSVGDDAFNLRLSQERAAAVVEALVSRGVDDANVGAEGFGETKPIADNRTTDGRAKNRRCEVRFVD